MAATFFGITYHISMFLSFYTMWFFICIKANKIQISLNQITEGYVLSQPSMLNLYRAQTSDCRTHEIVQRLSEKC